MNTPNRPPNNALRWILLAKAGAGLALVAGYWLQAHGFTASEYVNELSRPPSEPRYAWRRGKPTGEVERVQDAACTDWISKDFPARCRTFDAAKIAADIAKANRSRKRSRREPRRRTARFTTIVG